MNTAWNPSLVQLFVFNCILNGYLLTFLENEEESNKISRNTG